MGALTTWDKVEGGEYHSFAVKTDGTLWTWGYNAQGQLGDGTTTSRNSPVQVGALTTWLNAAAGFYQSVGTTTAGTLYAWGQNSNGELGLGDTTSRSSPVQVGSLTTWGTLPKMTGSKFCVTFSTTTT